MASLLSLVPGAVGQGQAQLVYAQVTTPAPTQFGYPLNIVIPDFSVDLPFVIMKWPACHGSTLPEVNDDVLVVIDNRGTKRVAWWGGVALLLANGGLSSQTPGLVATVTIAHELATTPATVSVTPANANARGAPAFYASADDTNITLTFASNLAGSTAYEWYWRAESF